LSFWRFVSRVVQNTPWIGSVFLGRAPYIDGTY
jgi:hypothetical protein